jgi:hypothetical protein
MPPIKRTGNSSGGRPGRPVSVVHKTPAPKKAPTKIKQC